MSIHSHKEPLYLCMGSACHQTGVYDVLPRVQEWIEKHDFVDTIELKGSFCLGPCTDGVVMKFRDILILNVNPGNVMRKLDTELLPELRAWTYDEWKEAQADE